MEIKQVRVPASVINRVEEYLKHNNIANRKRFDGNKEQQKAGLICQIIVYHWLTDRIYRLEPGGFDEGVDMTVCKKSIDVKGVVRNSYVRDGSYANNISDCQLHYPCDLIVCCSYHKKDHVVEMVGWCPKDEIRTRGRLYKVGEMIRRYDGTLLEIQEDDWVIPINRLENINTLKPYLGIKEKESVMPSFLISQPSQSG